MGLYFFYYTLYYFFHFFHWGAFSLVCVLSVLFSFFLSSSSFLFLSVYSLTDTNESQDSWEQRENYCFSCFLLPPAHEYSLSSSRFLPLLFNRSICNYQTDSWWDIFSLEICIFIDVIKSEFHISKWQCENLSSYQTNTLLLQSERFNQLTLTPLVTVYLSHLPNPTT